LKQAYDYWQDQPGILFFRNKKEKKNQNSSSSFRSLKSREKKMKMKINEKMCVKMKKK